MLVTYFIYTRSHKVSTIAICASDVKSFLNSIIPGCRLNTLKIVVLAIQKQTKNYKNPNVRDEIDIK